MADLDCGWCVVAGAGGLAWFLDAVLLWRARLTARGLVRCRRGGLIFAVNWTRTPGRTSAQRSGGKVRRPGGGTADDAQDAGVTDPVWVQAGGLGRPRDQDADRVVHD